MVSAFRWWLPRLGAAAAALALLACAKSGEEVSAQAFLEQWLAEQSEELRPWLASAGALPNEAIQSFEDSPAPRLGRARQYVARGLIDPLRENLVGGDFLGTVDITFQEFAFKLAFYLLEDHLSQMRAGEPGYLITPVSAAGLREASFQVSASSPALANWLPDPGGVTFHLLRADGAWRFDVVTLPVRVEDQTASSLAFLVAWWESYQEVVQRYGIGGPSEGLWPDDLPVRGYRSADDEIDGAAAFASALAEAQLSIAAFEWLHFTRVPDGFMLQVREYHTKAGIALHTRRATYAVEVLSDETCRLVWIKYLN